MRYLDGFHFSVIHAVTVRLGEDGAHSKPCDLRKQHESSMVEKAGGPAGYVMEYSETKLTHVHSIKGLRNDTCPQPTEQGCFPATADVLRDIVRE